MMSATGPRAARNRKPGVGRKLGRCKCAAKCLGECFVGHCPGRGGVHGAGSLGVVQGELDQAEHVLMVNPAHDLLARADRAADEHLERGDHFLQALAARIEDDAHA